MERKTLKMQVVEKYEQGDSVEDIAKSLGITKQITQQYLIQAGFKTAKVPQTDVYYLEFSEKWNKAVSRLKGIPYLDKIKLGKIERSDK